jgi:hypothetical protein
MDHGYFEPYLVGSTGPAHAPPVAGATAIAGVDSTSLPPAIEFDHGYHEQHLDTLRLLPHGGWQAINPARGSVNAAKPLGSVHQAAPAIPDLVATFTIVLVVCIASGVWIARYLVRPIVARGLAP